MCIFIPYVRGVIFNEKNEIFMQMRSDSPLWELPGGRVDTQEFFFQGIIREILEETHLTVKEASLSGIYHRWVEKEGKGEYALLHAFVCRVDDFSSLSLTEESIQQEFFTPDTLPGNTHPYYQMMIADALEFQKTGLWGEHDLSPFPRISDYIKTMPLDNAKDLDFWRQHPTTLQLKQRNELHINCIERFFQTETIDSYN